MQRKLIIEQYYYFQEKLEELVRKICNDRRKKYEIYKKDKKIAGKKKYNFRKYRERIAHNKIFKNNFKRTKEPKLVKEKTLKIIFNDFTNDLYHLNI